MDPCTIHNHPAQDRPGHLEKLLGLLHFAIVQGTGRFGSFQNRHPIHPSPHPDTSCLQDHC